MPLAEESSVAHSVVRRVVVLTPMTYPTYGPRSQCEAKAA